MAGVRGARGASAPPVVPVETKAEPGCVETQGSALELKPSAAIATTWSVLVRE